MPVSVKSGHGTGKTCVASGFLYGIYLQDVTQSA